MKEKERKLNKYIKGTAKALNVLVEEIKEKDCIDNEDLELLSKIGSNLLFNAKTLDYLD